MNKTQLVTFGTSAMAAQALYNALDGGLQTVNHLLPVIDQVASPTIDSWAAALAGLALKWIHDHMSAGQVPAALKAA